MVPLCHVHRWSATLRPQGKVAEKRPDRLKTQPGLHWSGKNGAVTEVTEGSGPARGGYSRSVSGLLGALIMVLILITFIWGLSRFQHRDVPDPARTIDYSADLSAARTNAPFAVLAPQRAPPGWRATSAHWDGAGPVESWHLGFLTGAGQYVGLEQSNTRPADVVRASTSADQPGPAISIRGQQWQTLSTTDGSEHALLRSQGRVTTLVTGTAPTAELRAFVATLRGR
jgi:hypothetical protein